MFEYRKISFADLCGEEPANQLKPLFDRDYLKEDMINDDIQRQWFRDGVVVLKKFIPSELIKSYCDVRQRLEDKGKRGGWDCDCPYLYYDEIKNICLYAPLMNVMGGLIGDEMGLHLNLTGWVSTERNWHQDDYLNPEFVNSWYAAVWMALDDIHPDSGPFEYIPGSHRWPLTRRAKLFEHLSEEEQKHPDWPSKTQDFISEAFEEEIKVRGIEPVKFLAEKGDVLIWHGRLAHRGTVARVPGKERKSLISHYSALSKRLDMPSRKKWTTGGWYFALNVPMKAEEHV